MLAARKHNRAETTWRPNYKLEIARTIRNNITHKSHISLVDTMDLTSKHCDVSGP